MTEVVGIRFQNAGKVYYFDPDGMAIEPGACVVVETSRGVELGECLQGNMQIEDEKVTQPLKKVLRPAGEEDLRRAEENKRREAEALEICQKKADELRLDMKVVDVEYTLDNSKLLFYFTAEGRVDFRDLVKALASHFHVRIELRQIGVRDEAKLLGGIGVCGRPFCCSSFLEEFHPVSIKMAKEQSLSLSPTKISGACGRLMCCLKYEQEAYTHLLKTMPRAGSLVHTKDGDGIITEVALLRSRVRVALSNAPDGTVAEFYPVDEVKVLREGKPRLRAEDGEESDR